MARRFLRGWLLLLGLTGWTLLSLPVPARAGTTCAGASPGEPAPLQSDAEASPIYVLLQSKLGAPSACSSKVTDDNKSVVFNFPQAATLTFSASEAIEASSQEAVLPASAISHADAVRLLRSVEQSSVPPGGCGIVWSKLGVSPVVGSHDAVAEGKACNCRAHLKTDSGAVVGLGFSIAC